MKQLMLLMIGLLLVVLTACTPMIYGVPQETWNGMNADQRTVTINIYQERQRARQIAAEERARQHAIYLEEQRQKEAAEAEAMRYRVEAIYRGAGNYGDLLRVRVENGTANFRGQVRQYDSIAFQIAKGEIKEVMIATTKNRRVILNAYYDGATLYLDGNKNSKKSRMSKLLYDKRWQHGLTYTDIYTNNKAKLKGAEVTVEIVGGMRNGVRYPSSGTTTIIIKEKPSKVIVIDYTHKVTKQQRQRQEQLKKERRSIEKQRKALAREQAQFEVEQLALAKERAELDKKRARIKQMKNDTARDKKQASKEKQKAAQERELAVKELEKAVEDTEKKVAKKETVVAKKEAKVKEKKKQVKEQEQVVAKEEQELDKEIKEQKKAIEKAQKNEKKQTRHKEDDLS